jgi:hypothetical protein
MALETGNPKERAAGEHKGETQPTRNEVWTPSRLEAEASGSAGRRGAVHKAITALTLREGDTPVGYLGPAALRREQCDVRWQLE